MDAEAAREGQTPVTVEAREQHALEGFESRLAAALLSADPGAALIALRTDPEVSVAADLTHAHEDGFRMAALIVARLRFERLLNGSPGAARAYREDAETFAALFRRYHLAVPPRYAHPAAEARAFESWSEGNAGG